MHAISVERNSVRQFQEEIQLVGLEKQEILPEKPLMNIDFSEQIADEAASPDKIDDSTESRNDSIIPFEANCFSPEKEDQISFEVSLVNSPEKTSPLKITLIDQEI